MAFEPLKTDEPIASNAKAEPDMDSQMLFGCSGFLIASLGGYALAIWPFFVFRNTDKLETMAISLALGTAPVLVATGILSRRYGLAGVCGSVGGAIAVSMFLYLRIQQAFLAYLARQAPEPQYPPSMEFIVPLAFLLAVSFVGVALLKPDK